MKVQEKDGGEVLGPPIPNCSPNTTKAALFLGDPYFEIQRKILLGELGLGNTITYLLYRLTPGKNGMESKAKSCLSHTFHSYNHILSK